MKETKIQHSYVMPFLCKSEEEGGLGYREVSHNIVSSDLFIPSVLAEFVKNNVTEKVWNKFIHKFGDEEALENGSITSEQSWNINANYNDASAIKKRLQPYN